MSLEGTTKLATWPVQGLSVRCRSPPVILSACEDKRTWRPSGCCVGLKMILSAKSPSHPVASSITFILGHLHKACSMETRQSLLQHSSKTYSVHLRNHQLRNTRRGCFDRLHSPRTCIAYFCPDQQNNCQLPEHLMHTHPATRIQVTPSHATAQRGLIYAPSNTHDDLRKLGTQSPILVPPSTSQKHENPCSCFCFCSCSKTKRLIEQQGQHVCC